MMSRVGVVKSSKAGCRVCGSSIPVGDPVLRVRGNRETVLVCYQCLADAVHDIEIGIHEKTKASRG